MVVKKITDRLKKTRDQLSSVFKSIFSFRGEINRELYEELEELLVQTDMGVETAHNLVKDIESQLSKKEKKDPRSIYDSLKTELKNNLSQIEPNLNKADKGVPTVLFVIGVNGSGKTTSVAKLANMFTNQRKKVILAACDTFRGAAIEQLDIWANKTGTYLVKHQHNSDAAAVAFDAAQAAVARKVDFLIVDTAGRLHTNKNLMEELKKIKRTLSKIIDGAPHEVLLTVDATTGQNAIQQAKIFHSELNVTGIILTKLDGTAKGGVVIRIQNELNIPVKYIGLGEGSDDLIPFNASDFVDALFEN